MALRLPPLSGLRLFEAAARRGSFKRAAQELNLTPGALSHGIDSLEQWLDVELFERKARGVVLTPAGRQFLPYVSEALSMIATGTLRLPIRRFEDRLSISATGLFADKLLLPRLHKFREMYPNMVVTVDASRPGRLAFLHCRNFPRRNAGLVSCDADPHIVSRRRLGNLVQPEPDRHFRGSKISVGNGAIVPGSGRGGPWHRDGPPAADR
jgi:hypothetical protein